MILWILISTSFFGHYTTVHNVLSAPLLPVNINRHVSNVNISKGFALQHILYSVRAVTAVKIKKVNSQATAGIIIWSTVKQVFSGKTPRSYNQRNSKI